jgi:predicted transcriptional regulator
MSDATFTFRVEENLKEQFTLAAKERDRSGAQLLRDFMRDYVKKQQDATAYETWFHREVIAGLDSANTGNLISAEQVEAESKAWRNQSKTK